MGPEEEVDAPPAEYRTLSVPPVPPRTGLSVPWRSLYKAFVGGTLIGVGITIVRDALGGI